MTDLKRGKRTSAGRLYDLLWRFQTVVAADPRANLTIRDAWCRVFGIEIDNIDLLFLNLSELQVLARMVRREIEDDTEANQMLLEHFGNIEVFVGAFYLNESAAALGKKLDAVTIRDLKYVADWLSRSQGEEEEVSANDLQWLAESLDEMVEQIETTDLEPELARVLLQLVETMRHSLRMYEIRGAEAFHQATAHAIGLMVINREVIQANAEAPPVKQWSEVLKKTIAFAEKTKRGFALLKTGFDVYKLITTGVPPTDPPAL